MLVEYEKNKEPSRYTLNCDGLHRARRMIYILKRIEKTKENVKEINDNFLKECVDLRLPYLDKDRGEALKEELNNIINRGRSELIVTAFLISKFLRSKKEFFNVRGNLASSYLAYELGIHDVDCFKYNIRPEICHGINYNDDFNLDYNINKNKYDMLVESLKYSYLIEEYLKVYDYEESPIDFRRAILIDDSLNNEIRVEESDGIGYKYISNDVLYANRDKVVIINFLASDDVTRLNEVTKTNEEKQYINIEEILENDSNIIERIINYKNNEHDLPELRRKMVQDVIDELEPKTVRDLARIISATHGTDVLLFQELLLSGGIIKEDDLILCRDDVADYLINRGINKELALQIMDDVRKGKGISVEEKELILSKAKIKEVFFAICNNIQYLFPLGHSISYIILAIYLEHFSKSSLEC